MIDLPNLLSQAPSVRSIRRLRDIAKYPERLKQTSHAVVATTSMKDITYRKSSPSPERYVEAIMGFGFLRMDLSLRGISALEFESASTSVDTNGTLQAKAHEIFDSIRRYFTEGAALPRPLLDLGGSAFQLRVWQELQTIPAGTAETYAKISQALDMPRATRAVASACAANRVALLVPCHRVIPATGGPGGYRWGTELKRALLTLERGRI